MTATPARYRCTGCGNLTRFDLTISRRTRAFHHYTVGGELTVEQEAVLAEQVEEVACHWCGTDRNVVELALEGDDPGPEPANEPQEGLL